VVEDFPSAMKMLRKAEPGIAVSSGNLLAKYEAAQEPCVLKVVGRRFTAHTGWAIAMGSSLTADINKAIKKLEGEGVITNLLHKWTSGPCDKTSGSDRAAVVTFGTIVFGLVLSMTALY